MSPNFLISNVPWGIVRWRRDFIARRNIQVCPIRGHRCLEICLWDALGSKSAFPGSEIYLCLLCPPWHTSTFAEITISSIPNCILLGTVFHRPPLDLTESTNALPENLDTDLSRVRRIDLRANEKIHKCTIYQKQRFIFQPSAAINQVAAEWKQTVCREQAICLCSCVNVPFVM